MVLIYNNKYYDYCDLISKFWLGSAKWNTPFHEIIPLFFLFLGKQTRKEREFVHVTGVTKLQGKTDPLLKGYI